jgi:hypothetical protein
VVVQVAGSGAGGAGQTWLGGHAGVATPEPEQVVNDSAWQTMAVSQSASTLHDPGWQVITGTVATLVVPGVEALPVAAQSGSSFAHPGLGGVGDTAEPDVPSTVPAPAPVC